VEAENYEDLEQYFSEGIKQPIDQLPLPKSRKQ